MYDILMVISFILMIILLPVYYWQVASGKSTPNPATWLIILSVTIINAYTYFLTTKGEFWPTILAVFPMIGVAAIVTFSFRSGKFTMITGREMRTILFSSLVVVLWYLKGAMIANFAIQLVFIIALYPTIKGVYEGSHKELWVAWDLAMFSYIFMTIAIIVEYGIWGGLQILTFPVVRVVVNGIMSYLTGGSIYHFARYFMIRKNHNEES